MRSTIPREKMLKIFDFANGLYKSTGISPYKIANVVNRKFGVSPCVRTIYWWIDKGRTPLRPGPSRNLLYTLYHKSRFSMGQIAKKLDTGKTTIHRWLRRYGFKPRNSRDGQVIRLKQDGGKFGGYLKNKLTIRQKQFLVGTLLGDGSMSLSSRHKNATFKAQQTEKDKEYVLFKHEIIKSFVTGKIIQERRLNKRVVKYYSSLAFIPITHPEFTLLYKIFYPRKRKVVNEKILRMVTPFGLAIWIMDDGHYNKLGKYIELYTMNFNFKEHLLMRKWFKWRYGISPVIKYHKQADKYYLRFNPTDTEKLVNIIRPHVIQSMMRKIGAGA